jgi:hypothetical protein
VKISLKLLHPFAAMEQCLLCINFDYVRLQ